MQSCYVFKYARFSVYTNDVRARIYILNAGFKNINENNENNIKQFAYKVMKKNKRLLWITNVKINIHIRINWRVNFKLRTLSRCY